MHLEGASDMKNNDNLKEKEIKQEKTMDKNELESVSGGFRLGYEYRIDHDICHTNNCMVPLCAQHCCHRAIKYMTLENNYGRQWIHASIDQEACTGCMFCKSKENCPHKALKWIWE
jgi:bacteriocin-like protein